MYDNNVDYGKKKEIMRDVGRPAAHCTIQANDDEGRDRP